MHAMVTAPQGTTNDCVVVQETSNGDPTEGSKICSRSRLGIVHEVHLSGGLAPALSEAGDVFLLNV